MIIGFKHNQDKVFVYILLGKEGDRMKPLWGARFSLGLRVRNERELKRIYIFYTNFIVSTFFSIPSLPTDKTVDKVPQKDCIAEYSMH